MRITILLISFFLSTSIKGQDMISRQAPMDKKSSVPTVEFPNKSNKTLSTEKKKVFKKGETIIIDKDEDWKWLREERFEVKGEIYPIELHYRRYSSHPQYRVMESNDIHSERQINVFTNSGSLVRAGMIYLDSRYEEFDENVEKELLRQLYIIDYNKNKHNFKKENAKAQNYVKRELGLIPDIINYNAWKLAYSPIGQRYLEQLALDHYGEINSVLKVERLNNLSFKVTFGDNDGNEKSTYKVSYQAAGAYKYKISTAKLPLEKIDWSLYIETEDTPKEEPANAALEIESSETTTPVIRYHRVKENETLFSIAKDYGLTTDELCEINHVFKTTKLRKGQLLRVTGSKKKPDEDPYMVEKREIESVDRDKVYDVVDEMPSFPGGGAAMLNYINSNLKYPVVAEENGIQGRVILTFVIDKDGSVTDVKVVKSVDPSLDKEAKRIIESMPNWIPGREKGVLVKTKHTVPVQFKLQ